MGKGIILKKLTPILVKNHSENQLIILYKKKLQQFLFICVKNRLWYPLQFGLLVEEFGFSKDKVILQPQCQLLLVVVHGVSSVLADRQCCSYVCASLQKNSGVELAGLSLMHA